MLKRWYPCRRQYACVTPAACQELSWTSPIPASAAPAVSSASELALLQRLLRYQALSNGAFQLQLHITQGVVSSAGSTPQVEGVHVRNDRIRLHDLRHALGQLGVLAPEAQAGQGAGAGVCAGAGEGAGTGQSSASTSYGSTGAGVQAYVCGPPQMTDELTGLLQELGVAPGNVHLEKWW